jgi:hypothetical protein
MIYQSPYPCYIEPPIHGILNPTHGTLNLLPMVYQTDCLWYIKPHIHGILNLLPMVSWPPILGKSNHIPRLLWPPYPWYIEPPTHGISNVLLWYYEPPTHGILNPLPTLYRTHYQWCIEPPRLVGMRDSIYHDVIQNTMTKIWPRGQNTIWYIELGFNFWGVQATLWHRFIVGFVLLNQVFCTMFYKTLFVNLSFFVCPLYCFSFLNLRFLYLQTCLQYIIYDRSRWAMQRLLFI